MAERFTRLYQLHHNLYSDNSPVIVTAGVLLKDLQTGSIVVQLKFQSVSSMPIKAMKIRLAAFDISGKEVDNATEYQYLDLKVRNGQSFGSDKAIILSNPVVRSFSICGISVIFNDNTAQEVSVPMAALPQSTSISTELTDAELIKTYQTEINKNAAYTPQKANGLWCCSCGEWNSDSLCTKCAAQESTVFSSYVISTLTQKTEERLTKEKAEREEQARLAEVKRQREEEERRLASEAEVSQKIARKKKLKLYTIIGMPVLAGLFLFVFLVNPYIVQPYKKYEEAQMLFKKGKYEEAISMFEELGEYKDAEAKIVEVSDAIVEAKYQEGQRLLNNKEFLSAVECFAELGSYGNSPTFLLDAKYYLALDYLSENKDEWAFEIFKEIRTYLDSESYIASFDFVLSKVDSGHSTSYYNDKGLVTKQVNSNNGSVGTYVYDEEDRIVKYSVTGSSYADSVTSYTYDATGNLIIEKTKTDYKSKYDYDDVTTIEYRYNDQGQKIWQAYESVDANNSYRTHKIYKYDFNGYLVAEYLLSDFAVSFMTYEYDSFGNRTSRYSYEVHGGFTLSNFEKFLYMETNDINDSLGNYDEVDQHMLEYRYDNHNNIIQRIESFDGKQYIRDYVYDNNNLLVKEFHRSDNTIINYSYDEFGNLINTQYSFGDTTTYEYAPVYRGE